MTTSPCFALPIPLQPSRSFVLPSHRRSPPKRLIGVECRKLRAIRVAQTAVARDRPSDTRRRGARRGSVGGLHRIAGAREGQGYGCRSLFFTTESGRQRQMQTVNPTARANSTRLIRDPLSLGSIDKSCALLKTLLPVSRRPSDPPFRQSLSSVSITLLRSAGSLGSSNHWLRRLWRETPSIPQVTRLVGVAVCQRSAPRPGSGALVGDVTFQLFR